MAKKNFFFHSVYYYSLNTEKIFIKFRPPYMNTANCVCAHVCFYFHHNFGVAYTKGFVDKY